MIRRLGAIILILLALATPARAAEELWLKPLTLSQLQEIYRFYDYSGERGYLRLPSYHYPPIFLSSFPADFATLTDDKERAAMFIKIAAPLALKVNQDISAERSEVLAMKKDFAARQELSPVQNKRLEDLAQKYDLFIRLKGYPRTKHLLNELLQRIDTMPPSFLIAMSALETDFGTSRIIKDGNAFYKQLSWHTDKGLKPEGETEDNSYRIKTYPSLYASMSDFALKLNSAIAYRPMRDARSAWRYRGDVLQGTTLAYSLLMHSPLKNYAGILEYTIAFYELNIIDKSVLDSTIISQPLPPQLAPLALPQAPASAAPKV